MAAAKAWAEVDVVERLTAVPPPPPPETPRTPGSAAPIEFSDFLERQRVDLSRRTAKQKKEAARTPHSFAPTICPGTRKMAKLGRGTAPTCNIPTVA